MDLLTCVIFSHVKFKFYVDYCMLVQQYTLNNIKFNKMLHINITAKCLAFTPYQQMCMYFLSEALKNFL